jgi:hypothetical protein
MKLTTMLTMACAIVLAAASELRADPVQLSFGYADNTHAASDGITHPSPWQGSSGVVFVNNGLKSYTLNGGPTNTITSPTLSNTYDGAAFKIVNTSGSSLTVKNFTVTITGSDTLVYNFANQSIASGGTLVLTQGTLNGSANPLGSLGANTEPGEVFDLSELSPTGVLAQNHIYFNPATVSFDIGTTHYSYVDSAEVLFGQQPDGGNGTHNETDGWTAATPEPASALMGLAGIAVLGCWRLGRRKLAVA